MADLIDRAELIMLFCERPEYSASMFNKIRRRIESAPAVDAVEVVRCKGCRHRYLNEDLGKFCCDTWADGYDTVVRDDDYCSYGEPKEERE